MNLRLFHFSLRLFHFSLRIKDFLPWTLRFKNDMILTGIVMVLSIFLWVQLGPLPGNGKDDEIMESHARFFGMGISVGLAFITGGLIEMTIAFLRSLINV